MKPAIPALSLILLFHGTLMAQTLREKVYIKGGNDRWENLMKVMYLHPNFVNGEVVYKNGQRFNRPLNYNRMLSTVQFIDERQDTLAIANEGAVQSISIGEDVFIYTPLCLQMVSNQPGVTLYKNVKMHVADVRQVGAYGSKNTGSAIETNNQIYTWMSTYNLNVNETLLLSKLTTFYIKGEGVEVLPANKKNVLALFSKHDERLKQYFKDNRVSFSSEVDLVSLTKYISQL